VAALEAKLNEPDLNDREFKLIPNVNPVAKYTSSQLPENLLRNRFRNILPYEDNRVHLPPTKENRTGYINASHIVLNIGQMQQRYIAAQGPLAKTASDFWAMVWHNAVNLIVMVTDLSEQGQEKCFLYFPNSEEPAKNTLQFDEFTVKCNFTMQQTTYVTSSLTLNYNGNSMTVWHIRYTDWPDHACPEDIQGFLSFLEGIDAVHRLSGREGSSLTLTKKKKNFIKPAPGLLVHCSAGCGRSGAVILCDAMLKSLDQSKELDVPKVLTQLRFQRMLAVQNFEQYKFVYRVLVQYLKNSRLI
jgi:tyrosine-protein phosphatase non-receptor type 14/21